MTSKHILFFLAHQYGHINPSLGMAMELVRRGHHVSYAVSEPFVPVISSIGASAIVLDFLDNREPAIVTVYKENDHLNYRNDPRMLAECFAVTLARTQHSLRQLEELYRDQKPDFIVRDDVLDHAGREFARQFGIPNALLRSQFVEGDLSTHFADEEIVLVTVPKFFQQLDEGSVIPSRYKYVGFTPEGRTSEAQQWRPLPGDRPIVLISPTTGLFKQTEFCRRMIEAFRDRPWDVILSLSSSRDAYSAIDPAVFPDLPRNLQINQVSANFDILSHVDLYIGQGGQGGALEAIYHGVPQIVVPASPYHYSVGQRVAALGLGACLPLSELSSDGLLEQASHLMNDQNTRELLQAARDSMHAEHSAEKAADVIESRLANQNTDRSLCAASVGSVALPVSALQTCADSTLESSAN